MPASPSPLPVATVANETMSERHRAEVDEVQARHGIIGRDTEIELALACLRANRHLLLEGPVGVGKTVLASALARHLGRPLYRVDGDERYTEQKLTGWFDPPLVIKVGYGEASFVAGPVARAMTDGGVLFINELNRMPESVQNVLLPALDEGLVAIPMLGTLHACRGFAVIATQNPREFVATTHLSEALRDRFEIIHLGYQTTTEEELIVRLNTLPAYEPGDLGDSANDQTVDSVEMIRQAVAIARGTRNHPKVKRGASVRAAISMVQIARALGGPDAIARAAQLALPTRIELREESEQSVSDIIHDLARQALEQPKKA